MSLIDNAFESCTIIAPTEVDDGYGSTSVTWADGDTFQAAITFDSSLAARVAEKSGVSSLYTVTTRRNVVLMFHTVFRRERDGKIFRVTSDGDDRFTPSTASLNMRQCSAEEWVIPNG